MVEKPILTLGPKEFLTGVSGSDFAGHGGIFKVANGVSAIRGIGSYNESNIGLLQAGPSGQNGGSAIVDAPTNSAKAFIDATHAYMYAFGNAGHVYQKDALGGVPTDLGASTQITSFANGCAVYKPKSATENYLYYSQIGQIGRAKLSAIANRTANSPTGAAGDPWKDNWGALNNATFAIHPIHTLFDKLFIGDEFQLAQIADNGSGDAALTLDVLDFPKQYRVNCLEDDGIYLIAIISSDKQTTGGKLENTVIFWDTFSASWNREYPIKDEIICMKRVAGVVYALGTRGVYTVSFASGVKKIWQFGSPFISAIAGTQLLSSFNDALIIGVASTSVNSAGQVALLGKPNVILPAAYHTPITIDSGTNITMVDAEFIDGFTIIGDGSSALKDYAMGGVSASFQRTGVNAETVWFPLSQPHIIKRIEIVFGRSLASGDDLRVDVALNDGSSYTTYGQNGGDMTFAVNGAKKRVAGIAATPVKCEALKMRFTFNGGVPAIQKVEVFGDPLDRSAML